MCVWAHIYISAYSSLSIYIYNLGAVLLTFNVLCLQDARGASEFEALLAGRLMHLHHAHDDIRMGMNKRE